MSQQRTLEQDRAKGAWENIAQVKGESYRKEYNSLVRRAPADIQINGLGQTLAFWRAKGKNEHNSLYEHVSQWVMTRLGKQHQQGVGAQRSARSGLHLSPLWLPHLAGQ